MGSEWVSDEHTLLRARRGGGLEVLVSFNFIQQKSPTSVSGEMNAYRYSIQWGFKPRLNKVKASGGCHRFLEEIYRAIKSGRKYAKANLIILHSSLVKSLIE
ncbi:hypothetical protein [Siminovitchia terrae]|uniref:hypothetical protein n=2 Tax=Siminovitchia terrae TaxID=1914933 RepID=UPI001BB38F57|nr:hypothetical protein [Siminovitchia terrae]